MNRTQIKCINNLGEKSEKKKCEEMQILINFLEYLVGFLQRDLLLLIY
jgi:hypothetical protein